MFDEKKNDKSRKELITLAQNCKRAKSGNRLVEKGLLILIGILRDDTPDTGTETAKTDGEIKSVLESIAAEKQESKQMSLCSKAIELALKRMKKDGSSELKIILTRYEIQIAYYDYRVKLAQLQKDHENEVLANEIELLRSEIRFKDNILDMYMRQIRAGDGADVEQSLPEELREEEQPYKENSVEDVIKMLSEDRVIEAEDPLRDSHGNTAAAVKAVRESVETLESLEIKDAVYAERMKQCATAVDEMQKELEKLRALQNSADASENEKIADEIHRIIKELNRLKERLAEYAKLRNECAEKMAALSSARDEEEIAGSIDKYADLKKKYGLE